MVKFKLKFIDHRPVYIPKLTYHRGGLSLKKDIEIFVTKSEKDNLLRMKNGNKKCFIEVKEVKEMKEKLEEEVKENGDR